MRPPLCLMARGQRNRIDLPAVAALDIGLAGFQPPTCPPLFPIHVRDLARCSRSLPSSTAGCLSTAAVGVATNDLDGASIFAPKSAGAERLWMAAHVDFCT